MPFRALPPCSVVDDLRLANPWPLLQQYADSIDLGTIADHLHSHIPYGRWSGNTESEQGHLAAVEGG